MHGYDAGRMPEALPLIVLGGSDRRAGALPEAAAGKHALTGYKGVDVRLGGRPLVEIVAELIRQDGAQLETAEPCSEDNDLGGHRVALSLAA